MTCFDAQSNIMAFIEKKLPDERVTDFVRHVKHCPNCSEELEIYYTLIVGMREVDTGKELSLNFKKDLDAELDRIDSRVKTVKRFKISTFSIICGVVVVLFFLVYGKILDKVYIIEQNMLKNRQGDLYFYETFSDYIVLGDKDIVYDATHLEQKPQKNFYEQIRSYNLTHIDYIHGDLFSE